MNNEELLEKIQSVVLESEKRLTKKIETVESRLEAKIETVDMKVEIVNKRIDQSIEENASFFHEIGVTLDQIRNVLLQKIKAIEKFVGLPATSKN